MNTRSHLEVNPESFKMGLAAINLLILDVPPLVTVMGAFRFPNQVELLIIFGHYCPVGVIITQGCGNNKPARKLAEEFDILVGIQFLGNLSL